MSIDEVFHSKTGGIVATTPDAIASLGRCFYGFHYWVTPFTYYGPFAVLERIGPVAYRLELPHGSRIHNVFHVSLLHEFVAGDDFHAVPLPPDFHGLQPVVQPVSILDSKLVWNGGKAVEHVLVHWADDGKTPTWEPAEFIRSHFPALPLEDKEVQNRGGVDTNPTTTPTPEEEETEMYDEETAEEPEVTEEIVEGRRTLRPRDTIKPPKRFSDVAAK